jgi:ATP/maltotriose-dependent transcriptional regulator MalT
MAALLRKLQNGPNRATVRRLLESGGPNRGAARPSTPLPETLTARERDVLHLLAARRTNPQIARALFLETNTVKTHLKSLYGKLGVHSRDEAVHRAHDLGLL